MANNRSSKSCPAECLCAKCCSIDLTSHLVSIGATATAVAIASIPEEANSERTRYATPGQKCGTGVVRVLSEKQVRFIKSLMAGRDTAKLIMLPGSETITYMSLRGASDLIDRLLACPVKKDATVRMASEKQLSFVESLLSQKDVPAGSVEWFDKHKDSITGEAAKGMIERLLSAPVKAAQIDPKSVDLLDGRYAIENEDGELRFYVVRTAKSSGRQHISVMASDTLHFIGGNAGKAVMAKIAADSDAGPRYGREIGKCYRCHRALTQAHTRAAGIGDDCASKI
jgi:hypothetical protein